MADPVTTGILVGLGFLVLKKEGAQTAPPPLSYQNTTDASHPLGGASPTLPPGLVTAQEEISKAIGSGVVGLIAGGAQALGGSGAGAAIGAIAGGGIADLEQISANDVVTHNIIAPAAGAIAGAAIGGSVATLVAAGSFAAAGALVAPAAAIVMIIVGVSGMIEDAIHTQDDINVMKKVHAKLSAGGYSNPQSWHDAWDILVQYYKDNNRPQYLDSWANGWNDLDVNVKNHLNEFQASSVYPLKGEWLTDLKGTKYDAIEILEAAYGVDQATGDQFADLLNDALPWYGHRAGTFRRNLAYKAYLETLKTPSASKTLWETSLDAFRKSDVNDENTWAISPTGVETGTQAFVKRDMLAEAAMAALANYNAYLEANAKAASITFHKFTDKGNPSAVNEIRAPYDLAIAVTSKLPPEQVYTVDEHYGLRYVSQLATNLLLFAAVTKYDWKAPVGEFKAGYDSARAARLTYAADIALERQNYANQFIADPSGVSVSQLVSTTSHSTGLPSNTATLSFLGFALKR